MDFACVLSPESERDDPISPSVSEFERNHRTKSQGSLRAQIRFYEALDLGLRRSLASQEREPSRSVHDGRSDEDSGDDLKEQGECERVHAAVGRPVERRRPRERHEQHRAAQDAWVGCSGEAHVRAADGRAGPLRLRLVLINVDADLSNPMIWLPLDNLTLPL